MFTDKPKKGEPKKAKSKFDLVDLIQGKRKEIARGSTHYCVVSGKHLTLIDAQKAFAEAVVNKGPYPDGGIHWRSKPVVTSRDKMFWITARFSIG